VSDSRAQVENPITAIASNVRGEIHTMRDVLGRSANAIDFLNLEQHAVTAFGRIERLIGEGRIEPLAKVRHSVEGGKFPIVDRALRVGVFPTAANPLHWAHLIGGLVAAERFHLDKVIFIIAGHDPRKPELASENVRHAMAKKVIELFHPLFEYSSIALGTATSGEENLFKILGMNPAQAIHAFYIAGGDHYHRFSPATGRPDTIQKLEDGLASKAYGFNGQLHRVSPVFFHREGKVADIPTFLDVRRVGKLPVQTSSTEIRWALKDPHNWWKLYALPFGALVSICGNRLWGAEGCTELIDEFHPLLRLAVEAHCVFHIPGPETTFPGSWRGREAIHSSRSQRSLRSP